MTPKPDMTDHDLLITINQEVKDMRCDLKKQHALYTGIQHRIEKIERWRAREEGKGSSYRNMWGMVMSSVAITISLVGYLISIGVF